MTETVTKPAAPLRDVYPNRDALFSAGTQLHGETRLHVETQLRKPSNEHEALHSDAAPSRDPLISRDFLRILAVQFTVGFGFSIYFLLPKYLAVELKADAATIGTLSSTPALAAVLASPWIGPLLDRRGRRGPLLAGGLLAGAASLILLANPTWIALMYVVRIAQGVGFALCFNAAAALVADLAPTARLGQAMGLLGGASLITNAIAPAVCESIAHAWGYTPVFALASATIVLGVAIASTLPAERPAPASLAGALPGARDTGLYFASFVAGAAFGTLITFTQPYALELGATRVSGYLLGYTLGALFVRVGFGRVADVYGRRRIAALALGVYGLVAFATSQLQPAWLLLFGVAFGLAHGVLYPALAALAAEGSATSRRGRALTRLNASFNLGTGAMLLVGGRIAQWLGYPGLFASAGLGIAACAVLFHLSPRRTSSTDWIVGESRPAPDRSASSHPS